MGDFGDTLIAAAKSPDEPQTEIHELLKTRFQMDRDAALASLNSGSRSSLDVARAMAAGADTLVKGLYRYAGEALHPPDAPGDEAGFAVIAVGGYGRGVLAQHSDIDLLFLRSTHKTGREEKIIETMLYALWDLRLKVGHSARLLDECMSRARADHVVLTSMLDSRLLAGDAALFETFRKRLKDEAIIGRQARFVASKLGERDARLARAGASRFMVEPDIKDGKGGLRDLNTLSWIAQALFPEEGLAGLPVRGLLSEADAERYEAAIEFLWTVRLHLHDAAGRAQEVLSFDYQPELAARMGYSDATFEPAVELFMRAYFRVATDVGALVRVASARLEALHAKRAPEGVARTTPRHARKPLEDDAYRIVDGRLAFSDDAVVEARPRLLLDIFLQADRLGVDIHPDAIATARDSLNLIGETLRADPRARDIFFAILTDTDAPAAILRVMIDAGVLGVYLPEFGRVVGRTQFNMYHAFTVDEHTMRAIGTLAAIERGRESERHPVSSEVMPTLKNRRALYLAMLLHDTGKAGGDQCEEGAKAARAACERWGLAAKEADLIVWLIKHHLDMSDAAQRRDLGDPKTIADFADLVETPERLGLLLCLTVADIRAVAPGVWNDFKAELLRELYRLTHSALKSRSGESAQRAEHSLSARAEMRRDRIRQASESEAVRAWLDDLEDAYWLAFSRDALNRHAGFADAVWLQNKAASRAETIRQRGAVELLVTAPDRPGLFADLAAAVAAEGADVVDARIFTTESGRAFDVFYLQTPQGAPFADQAPDALDHLEAVVVAAAEGRPPETREIEPQARAREAVFAVEPEVDFDDEASERHTVIEVSGRDRAGLLRDLARVLADCGMTVGSAHIESRGERAVDVFYVADANGNKITGEAIRADLGARLLNAMGRQEAAMEDSTSARGLRRAPSSPAR
ncbi:[protein-PII] uridylyltransferase [Euryhalocaulis caribicus]|uniref:[protein-PII] uridylyltransferase n=1 Tax=Euryhalocaulis caribicus TaxID=1161401 RepID=UPI0003A7EC66|nr:[protein-PII] uridylyltransferase [Euryhalocaulis caribicus]